MNKPRKLKLSLIGCLLILIQFSCGFSTEKRRPPALEKRLEERGIKIISDAEILEKVTAEGEQLTKLADSLLYKKLDSLLKKNAPIEASYFCAAYDAFLHDSLRTRYNTLVQRVALTEAPELKNPFEKNLIEAYAYSQAAGDRLDNNVQFYANKDSLLFNKPIFLADQLCLRCHGGSTTIPKELAARALEDNKSIRMKSDTLNQLKGMWSVRFSKKELVKNFNN